MTRGEKVCQFIEVFCPVPEGKLVGKPIKLLAFQRKFILDIYDNTPILYAPYTPIFFGHVFFMSFRNIQYSNL